MEKILEIIRKCSYTITVGVVLMSLVLSMVLASCEKEESLDSDSKNNSEISETIPEFSKEPESEDISEDGSYAAYYYADVTGEQVNEYIALLEKELGVSFKNVHYPKTAVYGEKLIAIHYNVTEKRLSITIAEKEYNENSNNIIGE